jgi:hypothetical protein
LILTTGTLFMKYLVIGSGRTAQNFISFLQFRNIPYSHWNRAQNSTQELTEHLKSASHVLLLISDSSLRVFFDSHLKTFSGPVIHTSGALEISGLVGIHPLASFTQDPLNGEAFEKIHFVSTYQGTLDEILPGFRNPLHRIFSYEKAKYHALCVMAGNFTVLLWQKIFSDFQKMGLSAEALNPYLEMIFNNIRMNPTAALTGPIARRDDLTIQKNLEALSEDSYREIYESFIKTHYPQFYLQQEFHENEVTAKVTHERDNDL